MLLAAIRPFVRGSVWPGIGVPAVAASGSLVANSMVGVWEHKKMLGRIGFGGVGSPKV
jgi:hypothetical protein